MNAKEFPLVTLCWNERDYLKIMAETCGHPTQTNEINYLHILQSCLVANLTIADILNLTGGAFRWDVDTFSYPWIETRPFRGNSYFKTSVRGQWSMLIHPKLGPCYSFEIDKSNLIDATLIYPNYSE